MNSNQTNDTSNRRGRRLLAAGSVAVVLSLVALVPWNMGGCAASGEGGGGALSLGTIGNVVGGAVGGNEGNLISAGAKAADTINIGPEKVNALGQSVAVAVAGKYGIDPDESLNRYVTLVGLTVASGTERPDANFVFGVLDTDEVNAFAGPNGYILVTRGAIQRMQDESELAGVLAHEIAHVVRDHGLNAVKTSTRAGAALQAAQSIDGVDPQVTAGADVAVDILINQGWNVNQENDADAAAVGYLVEAGYDPTGYLRFLQRMHDAGSSQAGQDLMSTHPGLDQRIGRVSSRIQQAGMPGGATLPERFRQHVPPQGG